MTYIKFKRSSVSGKVPATTDLDLGELAINTFDGKLYIKKNNGTESIVDIAGSGGGGSGTVTSVGLTAPTGFSVSNSPITGSGSLALSFASGYSLPTNTAQGNWTTAYNWGNHASAGYAHAGANTDITSMSGITGAIGTADSLAFDTTQLIVPTAGVVGWNSEFGTTTRGLGDGSIILDGMDSVAYVTNAEANTLTKGEVVYIFGASGNRASVKRAANTGDSLSATTLGIVKNDIAAGQAGYIVTQGVVDHLSLGTYTPGAILWLGSTPGTFTETKPTAPNHLVMIGVVERVNLGNGQIYVKVQNGYELDELHNVAITGTPTAGSLLIYDATNSLWKNAHLTAGTSISITNADAAVTITNSAPMVYPSAGIAVSTRSAWTTSLTAPSGTIVGTTDTQTLTNKRITARVNAQTTTASPWAWNSDSYDQQSFSALANALTINADAGTPTDGQKAMLRFKDNGTARALTWTTGATNAFRAIGVTLPTTTVISKTLYVGCVYNATDSRWDVVAVAQEA